MIVALSLDDFSVQNHNIHLIKKLKEHFPNFKVTVFASPFDIQFSPNDPACWTKNKKWLEAIKFYKWIEILPHGLLHKKLEWAFLNYDQASKVLDAIEAVMEEFDIPNKKIFKAPFWEVSYEAVKLLFDRGYTLCHYPNQKLPPDIPIKKYCYNWSINEPMPKLELLKAHGHIQNVCGNGLQECFKNLINLPENTSFKFVSEVI